MLLIAGLIGCGGRRIDMGEDEAIDPGAPDTSVAIDAVDAPSESIVIEHCPPSKPVVESPCSIASDRLEARCTYGTDPAPECRDRFRCWKGAWGAFDACVRPAPADCPAKPADAMGTCSLGSDVSCTYAGGTLCRCVSSSWKCTPRPADARCPTTVPNAGTPCSTPPSDVLCQYGPILDRFANVPARVRCTAGEWRWVPNFYTE